jgi:PAS domain S-box-containing protein
VINHFISKTLTKFDRLSQDTAKELILSALDGVNLLENVLDSIAQGILVCDGKHNLLITNSYAKHIIPIKEEEAVKKSVWLAVKDAGVKKFLQETLQKGVDVHGREIEVDVNGICRLLEFSVQALVEEGRIIGSVVLIADVTQKRVQEAKIRRIESLASLTTLAAGVAHEIKNPLAAISIHVQLIKKIAQKIQPSSGGASDLDAHIDVVNDEIKRLNKIVVDFLFAVRPMKLNLRKSNINDVIQEVIKLEEPEAKKENISLTFKPCESPPEIKLDSNLIRQALVNLVKNAIEAIKEPPLKTGRAERRPDAEIRLTAQEAGERIVLSVADTGPGIPEKDVSRIFEPYWTTKSGGSGLGLTLVFKIIQEHNGEIIVHSKEGEGACFLISLPLPPKGMRMLPVKKKE